MRPSAGAVERGDQPYCRLDRLRPVGETVAEYRQSFAIEVFYDQPLQIHSRFNLGHPRQIMVPLTGSGYTEGRFFIGAGGSIAPPGRSAEACSPVRTAVEAALNHHGVAAPTASGPIR